MVLENLCIMKHMKSLPVMDSFTMSNEGLVAPWRHRRRVCSWNYMISEYMTNGLNWYQRVMSGPN